MEVNIQLRDEDAEKLVLGTIISRRDALEEVRELLSNECFYNSFHQDISRLLFK